MEAAVGVSDGVGGNGGYASRSAGHVSIPSNNVAEAAFEEVDSLRIDYGRSGF